MPARHREELRVIVSLDEHTHALLHAFINKLDLVILRVNSMVTKAEFVAGAQELKAQILKAKGEIVARVAALEAVIAQQGDSVPQEVVDAFNDLKGPVQDLDDLNTDAVETPPSE